MTPALDQLSLTVFDVYVYFLYSCSHPPLLYTQRTPQLTILPGLNSARVAQVVHHTAAHLVAHRQWP